MSFSKQLSLYTSLVLSFFVSSIAAAKPLHHAKSAIVKTVNKYSQDFVQKVFPFDGSRIRIIGNIGDIQLSSSSATMISVSGKKFISGGPALSDKEQRTIFESMGFQTSVENGVFVLRTVDQMESSNAYFNLNVIVPDNVEVFLQTGTGDVRITNTRLKTLTIRTNDGNVNVDQSVRILESMEVLTSDGDIFASLPYGSKCTLKALTEDGDVNLEDSLCSKGRGIKPEILLRTQTGDINLDK